MADPQARIKIGAIMRKIILKRMWLLIFMVGLISACSGHNRKIYPVNQGAAPLSIEEAMTEAPTAIQVSWLGYVFLRADVPYELGSYCSLVSVAPGDILEFMKSSGYREVKVLAMDGRILGYSVGRVEVRHFPEQAKVGVFRPQPISVRTGEILWGDEPRSIWFSDYEYF